MPFLRLTTTTLHPQSQQARGLFSEIYRLEREGALSEPELAWFREQETWFNDHLPRPDRFSRSKAPTASHRAVAWFKDTAEDHFTRMHALAALLTEKGVAVHIHTTDRPGYVTCEDAFQVVAEPFRDTVSAPPLNSLAYARPDGRRPSPHWSRDIPPGAGTFLLWKRPTYSQRRDVLEVGDFKASVRTEEAMPVWIGPTLIAVGVGTLLLAARGRGR